MELSPDGRFVKIYRIRFKYGDIVDFIDVPESEYNETDVKRMIEEKIKTHRALLGK
jgi:hypothetical protein